MSTVTAVRSCQLTKITQPHHSEELLRRVLSMIDRGNTCENRRCDQVRQR